MKLEGGCQCGSIRYLLRSAPIVVYVCHCTDCQKQSSSAFGTSVWAKRDDFELIRGTLSLWQTRGCSGRTKDCTFCADCGSRIYHAIASEPEIYSLKGGSLDSAGQLRPAAHIWLRSAQRWVTIDNENLLCYQTEPDSFEDIISHYQSLKSGSE